MSTIFIAAIILFSTAGLILLFVRLEKKKTKKKNLAHLNAFHEAGSKNALSFSSQEVLRDKIIGLDGIKNTLLVLEFENGDTAHVVPMADIKTCTVKKEYDTISMGADKSSKPEQFLRSIGLQFSYKKDVDALFVSFYDHSINNIYEMEGLETKARTWESILSKLLVKEVKARA